MNGQTYTLFGLEFKNDSRCFQIRLQKPHFSRIGRACREFLLVSCTLLSISFIALATIVWVVTSLAGDINQTLISEYNRPSSAFHNLSHAERHSFVMDDYYAFEDGRVAFADSYNRP